MAGILDSLDVAAVWDTCSFQEVLRQVTGVKEKGEEILVLHGVGQGLHTLIVGMRRTGSFPVVVAVHY